MTLQRQVIFWIVALIVAVLLLSVFRTILLPFVAGFALAYMLDPWPTGCNGLASGASAPA